MFSWHKICFFVWEACGIPHYCHRLVSVSAHELQRLHCILDPCILHTYPFGYLSLKGDKTSHWVRLSAKTTIKNTLVTHFGLIMQETIHGLKSYIHFILKLELSLCIQSNYVQIWQASNITKALLRSIYIVITFYVPVSHTNPISFPQLACFSFDQ